MKYGLRYVASSPLIARVLIVYGLFIFLSTPAGFLAQLYVNRTYGTAYWYMTAVELVGFFGMTGGGILMSTWGGFKNRQKTFAAGLALFGVLAVGMGGGIEFYFVSWMYAFIRNCSYHDSDSCHNADSGKYRDLDAGAGVRITQFRIRAFSSYGNGSFWSFGRCNVYENNNDSIWIDPRFTRRNSIYR